MEEQNSFKATLNKYLRIEPELNLLNKPWNEINNKEDFFKIFENDLSLSVFDPQNLDLLDIESRTTYYLINYHEDFNDLYQIKEKHFDIISISDHDTIDAYEEILFCGLFRVGHGFQDGGGVQAKKQKRVRTR